MKKILAIAIFLCMMLSLTAFAYADDAKPFEGETLTVLYMTSVYADAARAMVPEFEEATGAKVEVVDFPYTELHQKILLDAISNAGTYDVVDVASQWDGEFAPFMTNLGEYIERDGYDTTVFIQNILDNHERLQKSYRRTVEADKQEVLRTKKSFMDRATEVMERNYMNSEFGIAELAEALGVSRTLLSKRLNAETGQSTGQFIRNYRLSVAKKMILENQGNRNITEIAYRVGFNDPKYFTRCFTRRYGNSPSSYTGEDALVDK
jgi:AraC-like DNA-binding protein